MHGEALQTTLSTVELLGRLGVGTRALAVNRQLLGVTATLVRADLSLDFDVVEDFVLEILANVHAR